LKQLRRLKRLSLPAEGRREVKKQEKNVIFSFSGYIESLVLCIE
jgi:hypothetical protein